MTTIVTVKTSDHAADVSAFPIENGKPKTGGKWERIGTVDAHSEGEFSAHAGQDILVQEVPAGG